MNPIIIGTPIATTNICNEVTLMENQGYNSIPTEVEQYIEAETPQADPKPNIFSKCKNLNEAYVIVKRYNGGVYFKRRSFVTDVKSNPTENCIYYNREEAQKVIEQANSGRMKCKYALEKADKYFVNLYYCSTYSDYDIYNMPISIKDFQAKKYGNSWGRHYSTSVKEIVAKILQKAEKNIEENEVSAKRKLEELPKRIEAITNDANNEAAYYKNAAEEIKAIKALFTEENLEQAKDFETQADKLVKVLYQGQSTK